MAIRTPVPKCLQKKNTFGGIFIHLTFLATTGKPQPPMDAKNTMTVVASANWKAHKYLDSLTDCSDVQRKVILGAIRPATAHWLFGHDERRGLKWKLLMVKYRPAPKLARSFVAGDVEETNRKKGKGTPGQTSSKKLLMSKNLELKM